MDPTEPTEKLRHANRLPDATEVAERSHLQVSWEWEDDSNRPAVPGDCTNEPGLNDAVGVLPFESGIRARSLEDPDGIRMRADFY